MKTICISFVFLTGVFSFFLAPVSFFAEAAEGAAPVSDFYKILGTGSAATAPELERAYKRAKKRLRSPGGSGVNLESKKRLEELEEIYETLQDPLLRADYDSRLKEAGFQEESNFYKVIGVLSDSPAAEITRAYQEIRQRIHPDKNQGDPEATRRFQELQEAHRILSDSSLRLRHDRRLRSFGGNLLGSPEASAAKKPAKPATSRPFKIAADLEQEASLETELWNEQIFQLARELETEGGTENIQEAVSWYRALAVEGHVEAARRLAPLIEDIDMKEALYRYRQGAEDDSDGGEFARAALFRQAQIYLTGVYKDDQTVIPKDPEKASVLFEQAFELGAAAGAVAREYDIIGDYETAMTWRLKKKGGGDGQISGGNTSESGYEITQNGEAAANSLPDKPDQENRSDSPIHQAVLQGLPLHSQDSIVRTLQVILRNDDEADWNSLNSEGRTALSLAAGRLDSKVVDFLIKAGADQTIPDADGFLPVHRALLAGPFYLYDLGDQIPQENLFEILSAFYPTWTYRAGHGKTPLETAMEQGVMIEDAGYYQNISIGAYLRFAVKIIQHKGVSYLANEEFDRILSKAANRKGSATVVELLMERKKSQRRASERRRAAGERRAENSIDSTSPSGEPSEKRPDRGFLSGLFNFLFATPSNKQADNSCRDSFSS